MNDFILQVQNIQSFFIQNKLLVIILTIWALSWKGIALWKSARNSHKKWFISILIINTMAILDIVYIFVFSKKKEEVKTEIKTEN